MVRSILPVYLPSSNDHHSYIIPSILGVVTSRNVKTHRAQTPRQAVVDSEKGPATFEFHDHLAARPGVVVVILLLFYDVGAEPSGPDPGHAQAAVVRREHGD